MDLSRRKTIFLLGGGAVLAAGAVFGVAATRLPRTAYLPWAKAGRYDDPRMSALSYALLAPSPHNRQPWLADLSEEGVITILVDRERLLPQTDPFNRQITIGLGAFLELLRMAAAEEGQRAVITPFPQGSDSAALDARPIARLTLTSDPTVAKDPLFSAVLDVSFQEVVHPA